MGKRYLLDSNVVIDYIAQMSWGSTDIRYAKLEVPVLTKTNRWHTKAWKGERVNAQAVVWTKTPLSDVQAVVSDLVSRSSIILSSAVTLSFVRYVMTDELNKDGKGGCSSRPNKADQIQKRNAAEDVSYARKILNSF